MRGWGGPALGAGDSYRLPMASSSWSATSAPLNATLDSGHRWVARGARARWDHLRLRWVVRSHPIAVCSSRQGVLDHAAAAHLRPVAAVAASQSANLHARGASRSGHPFGALEQWAPQSRVLLPCCVSPSVGAAPGRGLRFTAMVARWCSQFQPCRLLRDWSRPSLPNVEKLRSEQDPLFINPASVDSFARSTLHHGAGLGPGSQEGASSSNVRHVVPTALAGGGIARAAADIGRHPPRYETTSWPRCTQVRAKLANTSKQRAPASVLFPHDSFRTCTAHRKDRSARLFVGSAAGSYRQPKSDSRCLLRRFWIASSPGWVRFSNSSRSHQDSRFVLCRVNSSSPSCSRCRHSTGTIVKSSFHCFR